MGPAGTSQAAGSAPLQLDMHSSLLCARDGDPGKHTQLPGKTLAAYIL